MAEVKVAVALSGGVDSSVAALLLKEAGYEVLGVHMCLWDSTLCQERASHVEHLCHVLNIPFYRMDLQKEFDLYVVGYFCQEYKQGRTPNPCVACNQHIKFGFLLDKALSLGMDHFATGHYARIGYSNDGYQLLKAKDAGKDQSYFLYTLSQEKLKHLLFPLGDYSKAEVRQMAKQGALPVMAKPSQDICFISQKNYHAFLNQRFLSMPGDIADAQGKVLGCHQGIAFYTIGQRHGLGLALGKPLYVIRIEPEHNRVILGGRREMYSQKVTAKKLSWVKSKPPCEPIAVTAKIRYKSREAAATLSPTRHCEPKLQAEAPNEAKSQRIVSEAISDIWFSQPQWAVTPGQAIVFYKGDEVLGGGTID